MKCGLYTGRSALPKTRPTCFYGPVRVAAHWMWWIIIPLLLLYYDIHPVYEAAHVFSQAGPGRGP